MASSRDGLAKVSGSDAMAKPSQPPASSTSQNRPPLGNATATQSSMPSDTGPARAKAKKKNRNRKSKKNRRQSFVAPSEATETEENGGLAERPSILDVPHPRSSAQQASLYRLHQGNHSSTSLESEALLDHRDHDVPRPRRRSIQQSFAGQSLPFQRAYRNQAQSSLQSSGASHSRLSRSVVVLPSEDDEDNTKNTNDRTPLLSGHHNHSRVELSRHNSTQTYGTRKARRPSAQSRDSQRLRPGSYGNVDDGDYDVNNPPSVPSSPKLGSLDDLMITDLSRGEQERGRDVLIDIDRDDDLDDDDGDFRFAGTSPEALRRRPTLAELAERDVCFPGDDHLTEIDEMEEHRSRASSRHIRRRRSRRWPDLTILEDWSREEKEERTVQEVLRMKKIPDPLIVGGRLRPKKSVWHAEMDDAPFRFTYFNEHIEETIHARTISDLCQDGSTFKDLFLPDPPELSDDSDTEDEDGHDNALERHSTNQHNARDSSAVGESNGMSRLFSKGTEPPSIKSPPGSKINTGTSTPEIRDSNTVTPKPERSCKRYGPRPTFWLDVLKPTEMEMKVLAKAFGIHQLTTEDILMEEPREKVELFQSYYFVNYRSFEQDKDNSEYMEPVNIYVVVFRDGVITFHNSMTPHPANVRRRIRQLNDYMSPTADWISYAIIDDVTDAYAPLVQMIEEEVDDIDDDILYMHTNSADVATSKSNEAGSQGDTGASKPEGERTAGDRGGDMLRRVGECRKKVMGLYRLLGNKADVIKGFAKRCNEHWEVAPRSEIGLYLGDIQDHIVTMTGNLSHYENLLSRAHSNYLAQINIRMNERAEQTADVLGKLTVLGTIVLPMNIVTGMWGMNVWVPGQDDEENLTWFWCITAGLVAFGATCYFVAKRVYGIV